jgi:hypothetical protein
MQTWVGPVFIDPGPGPEGRPEMARGLLGFAITEVRHAS